MNKIILSLSLLMLTLAVMADKPVEKTDQRKTNIKIKRVVEYDTVIEILKKMIISISKGTETGKPVSAIRYSSFCNQIQSWLKYRWFIADTGLSVKWLKKIHELLKYMQKTKSYMEVAAFNGETKTPQYKKAVEYFNTAQTRLTKLISKPVRVSAKVQRKAKQRKTVWQKAMKKSKK